MQILVDADACPVRDIIEAIAIKYKIDVFMFTDTSHQLNSDYSKIITVSKANDAADFALINYMHAGDIVITQDYGVAAMALARQGFPMHHNGKVFNEYNIDQLLFQRHITKKQRRAGQRSSHAKKRTLENNINFGSALETLIKELL